jgi:3-hydroxy-9,10-secoandrosta-1,3,5(10)-triene-9,17-dione monooxygenase reductase component
MAGVDPASFRAAMGLLPTGVTVVTAAGSNGPSGATANAVCSLSVEPMLMLACLDRGSRTLRSVQAAGHLGINVLGAGQEVVARQFSTKAEETEKWSGIDWSERDGIPALAGTVLWVACELQDVLIGGDHVILTGAVSGLEEGHGDPLVFHRGAYRGLGSG